MKLKSFFLIQCLLTESKKEKCNSDFLNILFLKGSIICIQRILRKSVLLEISRNVIRKMDGFYSEI